VNTIDLDRLAALTFDFESGHPIESVLRAHNIPDRWSAYDVVIQQQKNRRFLALNLFPSFPYIGNIKKRLNTFLCK
jgi:hypothetical protein